MPELPEVETIKKDLEKLIIGSEILDIKTNSAKQIRPSLKEVKKAIVGAKIKKIKRRAKLLQILLDNKLTLIIHLKMTGRILIRKKGAKPDKWQRITISLDNNKELRFADSRKFGWIKLVNQKELKEILADYGPEPLDDLSLKNFQGILKRTKRPVKIVLMDQKKISGIGNIYANDALFLAKINPQTPSNKLNTARIKQLFQAIEKVLKIGLKARGASDQYYLDALGKKGNYQKQFLVYGQENKKCSRCGAKIKRISLGGRGTFFCPQCQKEKSYDQY